MTTHNAKNTCSTNSNLIHGVHCPRRVKCTTCIVETTLPLFLSLLYCGSAIMFCHLVGFMMIFTFFGWWATLAVPQITKRISWVQQLLAFVIHTNHEGFNRVARYRRFDVCQVIAPSSHVVLQRLGDQLRFHLCLGHPSRLLFALAVLRRFLNPNLVHLIQRRLPLASHHTFLLACTKLLTSDALFYLLLLCLFLLFLLSHLLSVLLLFLPLPLGSNN